MVSERRDSLLCSLLLVLATVGAYANTFGVPFLFDDVSSIVENPTIRQLWPPTRALVPPSEWGFTVSGRPVLNLSLAFNYALSGYEVSSYHATNLVIHVAAGLVLFGVVRRTLRQPLLAARFGGRATWLGGSIAALWLLHPLQTESVTYIVQRAESLMGLFFLFTLYAFIRASGSPYPRRWWTLAFVSCLLGAGTKEVAALAPVMVFLYDRTFVSGSLIAAWRRHRAGHLALASTWLALAALVVGTGGNRGGTMGFDLGVSAVSYWLIQFEAVVRYLWLAVWPHPLVFDYGKVTPPSWPMLLVCALIVLALAIGTLWALRRRPVLGFLGAWFFGILAPTSIVPGALQMIVEHRMYLPLAAPVALGVLAAATVLRWRVFVISALAAAAVLGWGTFERNRVYGDEELLWRDTIAKRPENARAHNNLGRALYLAGRYEEAVAAHRASLRFDPGMAQTHFNLGLALVRTGRLDEAVEPFRAAVGILPYYFQAHLNLGTTLTKLGRAEEALPHFEAALRHDPEPAEVHFQLGIALARLGRWEQAALNYAETVRREPTHAQAYSNWGVALSETNAHAAAVERLTTALQLAPDRPEVHFNLALAYQALGRAAEARSHYAEAVRLDPAHVEARLNLGIALGQAGDLAASIAQLEEAVRLRPAFVEAHTNLAVALSEAGRPGDALRHFETALQLRPDDPQAHYNLAYALAVAGRLGDARSHLEQALRLQPNFAAAAELLRQVRARLP